MTAMNSEAGADSAPASSRHIRLGDREYTLERVSARKASRALAIIRALTKAAPDLQREWSAFRRRYEEENVVELDRAQAALRYPAQMLIDDEGNPVREPELDHDGTPHPRAGQIIYVPSPLDRMTEEDWQRAGHVLKYPQSPSTEEQIVAVLDSALELGEEHVYNLLAIFTLSNSEVASAWRSGALADRITERADELLDNAFAEELLELAVLAGELVDTQFVSKAKALSGRMGNLARLVGMAPTRPASSTPETPAPSTDGPSSSTPSSSMDSDGPTDGAPTPSSTSHGTLPSSSPSSPDATPTKPRLESSPSKLEPTATQASSATPPTTTPTPVPTG